MESLKIQNKLKLLFERLAEPNYVMDNYYVDGLINKLSNCTNPETSWLERIPLVSDLIIEALERTDNAHITVKVFLTRICALATHHELHYNKIFSKHGDKIAAGFKEICETGVNPSIKVAYMEMALGIVKHDSGIAWILETVVWKEILKLCNQKSTVFISRQTNKFMTEFLWKLNDKCDETNIRNVLGFVIHPLCNIDFLNVQAMTSEEEEAICREIEPSLQVLLSVLSQSYRILNDTLLVSVLAKEYKITSYLHIACEWIRSDETILLIGKLMFLLNIAKVFLAKPRLPGVLYTGEEFLEVTAGCLNLMQNFIQRRKASLVLDYAASCIIIWNTIYKDKDPALWVENANNKSQLKNQMVFISLVPLMVFVTHGKTVTQLQDIRMNEHINRLLTASCEYTAKAVYALRDLTGELDTLSVILQSVKKLMCLKEHLNDEQANIVFQAMFYVLLEYCAVDLYGEFKQDVTFEDSEEKDLIIMYVMDVVVCLVTNYNIHWHESVEVICLYNVGCNILKKTNLTSKFVVKALNLIILSVKKFLQPNLSLLLESKPGTAIHDIGKLIFMKMNDRNWEIRDTALELLYLCTDMSFIKFPHFQNQIIDNNLINLAATLALHDFESYVQVSALKCIGAATRVSVIWDKLLMEFPDMQEKLLSILRHNEEGIVRKEACNVLCELYQNSRMTPAFKETLYKHMVSSALADFHWEVQVSALKFWKVVYQAFLNNQGMLDGQFPPVTFSKETRKIVTLNEPEIQKRLVKILEELAAVGCLTVFVKLLHDETEVEIMDVTLSIAQELYDLLKKYKVPDCVTVKPGETTDLKELLSGVKEEEGVVDDNVEMVDAQNPDNVIEDILNVDDIKLLASIYERHMSLQANKKETPLEPKLRLTKFVTPYVFVNFFKNKDLRAVIDEKRRWNEGIKSMSSLLDDVLGIYEINAEVNSMDCY